MATVEASDKSIFVPIHRPNRKDLRSIPLGAHMILANLTDEGVEFSGAEWSVEDRDRWIEMLGDEGECFGSTTIIYVDPARVIMPNMPVREPKEIVNAAISGWVPTGDMNDDIDRLMYAVIGLAREGMVVNPF